MGLLDQLDEDFAPAWNKENRAGAKIAGTVTGITTRDGFDGKPYRIIEITQEDGERFAVHAFHFVLAEELAKIRPQVGHKIGIKCLGKPEGKNYVMYRVVSENAPQEDWGDAPQVPSSDLSNDFDGVGTVPADTTPVKTDADDDVPF